jgi:hypothetical protein
MRFTLSMETIDMTELAEPSATTALPHLDKVPDLFEAVPATLFAGLGT